MRMICLTIAGGKDEQEDQPVWIAADKIIGLHVDTFNYTTFVYVVDGKHYMVKEPAVEIAFALTDHGEQLIRL